MKFRDAPIRRKLTVVILLTSVTVILAARVAFFIFEYVTFRQATTRQVSTLAEVIAANSTAALAFDNREDAQEVLSSLRAERKIVAACMYKKGELYAQYPTNRPADAFPAAPGKDGFRFSYPHLSGFQRIVQGGNKRLGTLYLEYDVATTMHEWLRHSVLIAVPVFLFAVLVAFAFSPLLQRHIAQPILALAGTARAISEQRDFSVRAKKSGRDEIGLLTDDFNQMLANIEERDASLRKLSRVVEQGSNSVIITNPDGVIEYVNPAFEKLTGYTSHEAVGKNPSLLKSGRHDAAFYKRMWDTILAGETFRDVIINKKKDGGLYHEDKSITPLKDPNGQIVHFVATGHDITQRINAENEIRELNATLEQRVADRTAELARVNAGLQAEIEARRSAQEALEHERFLLHTFMENVPDRIYFKDLQSRFLRNNRAHLKRFGITDPAQALGKTDFDFFSGEHAKQAYEDEQEIIRTGQPMNKEEKETWPDGNVTWALSTKLPMRDAAGRITGTFGITHDITARKRAEEEVNQARDAAVALNKELEAFSYSVSHDLRAPLRHISGFVELLNQTSQPSLDDSGKRYLGIISDAAKQMGKLIDDLLVFSRLGRSEMRRSTVLTDELVGEVVREMAQDLAGRNIAWEIGPLPAVFGDRAMIKQVWVNLLSNAVKYTGKRERAVIKIASRKNDSGDWEFSVQDNGAGFDMQYAGKLFGVFQRLHQAEEFEGTGIGLANVQRIVLRHGGRVWAEGKVDAGATFSFTLPDIKKENT